MLHDEVLVVVAVEQLVGLEGSDVAKKHSINEAFR
jgi:hypothetical protein